MPELAEVKITSEFVDTIVRGRRFTHMTKSEKTKVKTDLEVFNGDPFWLQAKARGKEMKIIFTNEKNGEVKELMMFLGMSGMFVNLRNEATQETKDKFLKHGHLRIHDEQGGQLVFYDVRRFGKWKWIKNDSWSSDRGPCPVSQFKEFKQSILENWQTSPSFNQPISTLLMHQYWFNGIGNYLRAEILYRVPDVNPWTPGNKLTEEQLVRIIDQCSECPQIAYKLQGGQFKDWVNPFSEEEKMDPKSGAKIDGPQIESWRKVYGVKTMSYVNDENGRRFWFDPKWNEVVPEKYKKESFFLAK